MPDQRDPLNAVRAFAGGIAIIGDADTREIPSLDGDNAIASSASAVVVQVRHAQDVADPEDSEFLVEVRCIEGTADRDDLSYDGEILIASGRLSIGDADHDDTVVLTPGRWRLQIGTQPVQLPERLSVWFSRPCDGSNH